MAMVVKNNIAAQMVLGELNKNQSKLSKSLEKVSSGEKIKGAKDDASGYAISEKMREQIRSLAQDNQNVQNGMSMLKIASGGVDNIVEELRNLKEIAINAANDTNTDVDRKTMQKEFSQKMANINDIATMTNYNGKILLDGTYHKPTVTSESGSADSDTKFASVFKEVSEPTGTTQTISGTNFTITSDGVYEIAVGFTGKINVNAKNVKITQANPSTTLNNVEIIGPSGGNANLWIENLNITTDTANSSIITFQGADNVLTVRGDNTLKSSFSAPYGHSAKFALICSGGSDSTNYTALNVQGDDTSTLTLDAGNAGAGNDGAGIGANSRPSTSTTDITRYTTGAINIVNLNLNANISRAAVVGSGGDSSHVGNITVENSKFTVDCNHYCGIAIGATGSNSSTGNILVVSSELDVNNGSGIGVGMNEMSYSPDGNNSSGTITVHDTILNYKSGSDGGVGIGIGRTSFHQIDEKNDFCGDIFVSASTINTESNRWGAGIGSGIINRQNGLLNAHNIELPNITITDSTKITHKSPYGAAVGSFGSEDYVDCEFIVGDISISQSSYDLLDVSQAYQDANQPYPGLGNGQGGVCGTVTIFDDTEQPANTTVDNLYNPLKIQHGTKANQATNFYINDMHTKSLGTSDLIDSDGNFIKEEDEDRYWALSYDKTKQAAWLETITNAQNLTIDDISVTTQKNANIAIRVLDGAIDYALDESTRLGAYLQRLEYTDANVTTMGENVQSAESTIRDADMAKEMAEYTKANVLTQAAQSMLAQANQNSSAVLSLLQ